MASRRPDGFRCRAYVAHAFARPDGVGHVAAKVAQLDSDELPGRQWGELPCLHIPAVGLGGFKALQLSLKADRYDPFQQIGAAPIPCFPVRQEVLHPL